MKKINPENRVTSASLVSAIIIAICIAVMAGSQSLAATLLVTSATDSGPGSLRNTIDAANAGDTIEFSPSLYGQSIILTSGELPLVKNVTISGPGSNQMEVTRSAAVGTPAFRIFNIALGVAVTIQGLTISNGLTGSDGGAIYNNGSTLFVNNCVMSGNSARDGGAIYNYGRYWTANLEIANSTFSGNSASVDGGAIANVGILPPDRPAGAFASITNSNLTQNSAYDGGAIMNLGGSAGMDISMTTVNGNVSRSYGGGILNLVTSLNFQPPDGAGVSISDSTISGNTAATAGGGICNVGDDYLFSADVQIINSTVSDNMVESGSGGGICNLAPSGDISDSTHVSVSSATISGNSAATGGGIYNDGGYIVFRSSILKHGSVGSNLTNNVASHITSAGYNLSSDSTGPVGVTDRLNVNPRLGPLRNNGGPTFTHALLPGSPAIDAGDPSFPSPPDSDQRGSGFARIVNGHMDVGSFELQTPAPALTPDFNNDGKIDYLLQNANTRKTAVWLLDNNSYLRGFFGPTLPVGWTAIGTADFNLDRETDYTLFNPITRQTAIWYLNRGSYLSGRNGPTLPSGWQLIAAADFNGDTKPDFVLYHTSTRQTAVWYMNNNVRVGGTYGPILPGWKLVGVADFNRDGKTDYALFNPGTRQTGFYYLSGTAYVGSADGPTIANGYELKGVSDFDGDGNPDYVLYNPSTRQTVIWYLNNNVYTRAACAPTLPTGWSVAAP